MRADLDRRYADARADASRRVVDAQIAELERILEQSAATISIQAKLLYNMAAGQNYTSYYKALDGGLRKIAERRYHEHRVAVDAKIHPGYGAEIVNAALSPDGRGLTNYGEITLVLHHIAIEDRASVMRENAFDFYERNALGGRDAQEEPGWRSIWADRARLGIAHLAPSITPALARSDLPATIMLSSRSRHDDKYMEIHIYGDISWQSLRSICLEKPLTDPEEQEDWDFGRQKLAHRGIAITDRVHP